VTPHTALLTTKRGQRNSVRVKNYKNQTKNSVKQTTDDYANLQSCRNSGRTALQAANSMQVTRYMTFDTHTSLVISSSDTNTNVIG